MIPVYYANITDEFEGITTISLVDRPAVQSDFVAFDEQEKVQLFKFEDEEQRKIMGVIMRCEYPIYRNSDIHGEFYIKYSRDVIERMTRKMLAENTGNYINLMHDGNAYVDGVTLEQVFIKDSEKGVNPSGFEDISDGSMFGVFHVENDDVWNAIKSETFKGFSLEGYFSIDKTNDKADTKMSLKEKLRSLLAEFAQVETDGGILVAVDEVEVGSEVTDKDGNPIADGEYKSEDKVYVVKDGKVEAINEIVVEEPKEDEKEPSEPSNEPEPIDTPQESEKEPEEPKKEEIEAPVEPIAEPKDYQPEVDALKASIEALQGEIDAIKEMLKQPASTPIEEEFTEVVEAKGKSKLIDALNHMKNK